MPILSPYPSRLQPPAQNDLKRCRCRGGSPQMAGSPPRSSRRRFMLPASCRSALGLLIWFAAVGMATDAAAQVRGKTQDRGSYQPPVLDDAHAPNTTAARQRTTTSASVSGEGRAERSANELRAPIDQVAYDAPAAAGPAPRYAPVVIGHSDTAYYAADQAMAAGLPPGPLAVLDASCGVEPACGVEPFCGVEPACGLEPAYGPEPFCGVEAMPYGGEPTCGVAAGCDGCGNCQRCAPSGMLCLTPERLFGSAELLLWWRRGQSLPPLVTTGPASAGRALAGRLDQTSTEILFGGDRQGESVSSGGRFTLGTWLDECRYRSLTGRFWGAGSESYSFAIDDSRVPVITRPFFDVDGNAQNTSVIAFPNQLQGSVTISGHSDVYGADVTLGQLWRTGLGGNVDFLYGYQFLRVNEDLNILSHSRVIATDQTLPAGATITVSDGFDVQNEFHGAHFGASGRFREGCWTYSALVKLAFGSLHRRADLRGTTVTSNGGQVATTNEGLLVRATNAGSYDDATFAWMPEVNIDLAYRLRPGLDFSVGYNLVVLTDALQPWRTIDSRLAVDLPDDPATATRPIAEFQYGDFWLQGINFGLHWNY